MVKPLAVNRKDGGPSTSYTTKIAGKSAAKGKARNREGLIQYKVRPNQEMLKHRARKIRKDQKCRNKKTRRDGKRNDLQRN